MSLACALARSSRAFVRALARPPTSARPPPRARPLATTRIAAAPPRNCLAPPRNCLAPALRTPFTPEATRSTTRAFPRAVCGRAFSTAYLTEEVGAADTKDYRIYLHECERDKPLSAATRVSPWFDIPLSVTASGDIQLRTYNFVVEIPKGTNAKMESALEEEFHPIKQDENSDGSLRFLKHGKKLFNYGFLPQTWEDPRTPVEDEDGEIYPGDGDPLDAIEIGDDVAPMGSVKTVKAVGCLGLIDSDEMDWKILVIDVKHPKADLVNDVTDVEKHFPGAIASIREWYMVYKLAEGKSKNKYAFGGRALDREHTEKVIKECHLHWRGLFSAFDDQLRTKIE